MTAYSETAEAVRLASREIGDGEWDGESHAPNRAILAGKAQGVVSVFPSKDGAGAVVSLEIDGMTEKQAVAVLEALTPRHVVLSIDDVKGLLDAG